ncbi:hypothetical protein VTL71DRAFT_9707 [Oculimacula yallundae]|uniref:Uncharacterized protein n=1 Tax=Oculimacula yallundae TaxID=86028 RepID=A0ABR4BRK6_9HELO
MNPFPSLASEAEADHQSRAKKQASKQHNSMQEPYLTNKRVWQMTQAPVLQPDLDLTILHMFTYVKNRHTASCNAMRCSSGERSPVNHQPSSRWLIGIAGVGSPSRPIITACRTASYKYESHDIGSASSSLLMGGSEKWKWLLARGCQ